MLGGGEYTLNRFYRIQLITPKIGPPIVEIGPQDNQNLNRKQKSKKMTF